MSSDWRRPLSGVKEQLQRRVRAETTPAPTPPPDGFLDLADPVENRRPRGRAGEAGTAGHPGRTTLVLGGAVLVVAGFLGGVLVQKNYGTSATGSGTRERVGERDRRAPERRQRLAGGRWDRGTGGRAVPPGTRPPAP
jgi:hypothetical protein